MSNYTNQPYFFSSDLYLKTLAEVFFSNDTYEIKNSTVEDQTFRLLYVNNKPITSFPFLDFLIPFNTQDKAASTIPYIQRVALEEVVYQQEQTESTSLTHEDEQIAPFIALSSYPSWEQYMTSVKEKNSKFITDTARRLRKLETDYGQVTFNYKDLSEETFKKLVAWKSSHYDAFGGTTMFLDKRILTFFKALEKKGAVIISSISVNNTVIAAHLGAYDGTTLYSWIPSYDKTFAKYSPGRILLTMILEECYSQGIKTFDFLLGGENYKWYFATHFRPITSIGTMPFNQNILRSSQGIIKKTMLHISPSFFYRSKKVLILMASPFYSIRNQKNITHHATQ